MCRLQQAPKPIRNAINGPRNIRSYQIRLVMLQFPEVRARDALNAVSRPPQTSNRSVSSTAHLAIDDRD